MADINDVRLSKLARISFYKHGLDISMADVRVTYGLCSVRGRIKKYPKAEVKNVEQQSLAVCDILKRTFGIKEVVMECTFDEDAFK